MIHGKNPFAEQIAEQVAQIKQFAMRLNMTLASIFFRAPSGFGASFGGGRISGYTRHGLNQAISRDGGRGVKAKAILDAVKNPLKVSHQSGGRVKYVGKNATVIVNQQKEVITTFGKARGPKIW